MRYLNFLIVVTAIFVMAAGRVWAVMPDEDAYAAKITQLENQLADANAKLATALSSLEQCQRDLQAANSGRRNQTGRSTVSLRREIKNLNAQIAKLQKELAAANAELAELRKLAKPKPKDTPPADEPETKETDMEFLGIPWFIWLLLALAFYALVFQPWKKTPAPPAPVVVTPSPTAPTPPPTTVVRGSGTSTPGLLDLNAGEMPMLSYDELLEAGYDVTTYTTPTAHYRRFKAPRKEKVIEKFPDPKPGHAYAEVRIPTIELGVVCRERHEAGGPTKMSVDDVERILRATRGEGEKTAKVEASDRTDRTKTDTSKKTDTTDTGKPKTDTTGDAGKKTDTTDRTKTDTTGDAGKKTDTTDTGGSSRARTKGA